MSDCLLIARNFFYDFPEVCAKSNCLFQGGSHRAAGIQNFPAYQDTNIKLKPEDGGHSLLL